MQHDSLALLRALAERPSRTVAPSLQRLLDELVEAGLVARDGDGGWMATARGCDAIERHRRSLALHERG
jgi:hypothetical protein